MPIAAFEPAMRVNLGGLSMRNPVTDASGTFAAGREYADFVDIEKMGAVTTKGVSLVPWAGNDSPRIAETAAGMLNSIGLQNPGAEAFKHGDLVWLAEHDVPVIVNACGHSVAEYEGVIEALADDARISAFEVNISCPNVDAGGLTFGTDPHEASRVVRACRAKTSKPLIVKLTPNVTDITEIARAAEEAGADAISLINTVLGMAINARTRRPVLARAVGGLSGPAVKPIALRMVWQTYHAVNVPILGMGGISCAEDAIEFMLAGATAVAVGTASFVNPHAVEDVVDGMRSWCIEQGIRDVNELIGGLLS